MQSPIVKSICSSAFKNQTKFLTTFSICGLFIFNKNGQSIKPSEFKMLFTSTLSNFGSDKVQFEKVTGFESIVSRITNISNVNDLLSLTSQNILLLKNEHIVLSLRILARLVRTASSTDIKSLMDDERYIKLINKAKEAIDQFNEYEILDFLFWLRRFKISNLPTHTTEVDFEKLNNKILSFVKAKSFNFRNLVNLYYDLAYLNKNVDDIVVEIINELKLDIKYLTPFSVVQLLQASSRRNFIMTPKILAMVDFICKNLANVLPEFENDQKCQTFKYFALLELDLNPPKYKLPLILYTLKAQLKEELDSLSEESILHILDAYEALPKEFPADILDEVKEMVILTINHNSSNIKSSFLLEFLKKIMNLKKNRRLTDEKINIIYDEITKRLPNDDYWYRIATLEKLINVYDNVGLKNEQLLHAIYKKLNEHQPFTFKSYELLIRNSIDISDLVEKMLNSGFYRNATLMNKIQIYNILTLINSSKFEKNEEELHQAINENQDDLYKYVHVIVNSNVDTAKSNALIEKALNSLEKQFGVLRESTFFKHVINSTQNKIALSKWINFIKENRDKFERIHIVSFYNAFFALDEYSIEQLTLFDVFNIKLPSEKVPLKRILANFKNNRAIAIELVRNEILLNRIINNLTLLIEHSKEEIKLYSVYGIAKRYETLHRRMFKITMFVKKAFEMTIKNAGNQPAAHIELLVGSYLLERNSLKNEEAKNLYQRLPGGDLGLFFIKLYSFILRHSSDKEFQNEETIQRVNGILETLHKQLSETNAKSVLNALSVILTFPPKFLQQNRDLYLKSLKDYIGFANQFLYLGLVMSLHHENIFSRYDFYSPFIRELVNHYNTYNKKLSTTDMVNLLAKFSEINVRNPAIYNNILTDLCRLFNMLKNDEKIQIVQALAKLRIKQSDLFDKIIKRVDEVPHQYTFTIITLMESLFKVGYKSDIIAHNPLDFIDKFKLRNSKLYRVYLQYVSMLNIPMDLEKKIFEKYIPLLHSYENVSSLQLPFYEYVKYVHKANPEWLNKLNEIWPELITQQPQDKSKTDKTAYSKNKNLICEYLKSMNVEYKENITIEDYNTDIFLPNKKIIIKILLMKDVNFDKVSLSGKTVLIKKIYESFKDYITIMINSIEFYNLNEHMNRVNYLISHGIESNNTSGVYDFSHIALDKKEVVELEIESTIDETEKETDVNLIHEEDVDHAIHEGVDKK